MRTYVPSYTKVDRSWHVVDAEGLVLGRMASEVARVLRGKHKPSFVPNADLGDHVIVVNASKVVLTAGKSTSKVAYRHSGYPGGLRATNYQDLMARHPERVVRKAVSGMLPKGPLGRGMVRKLKVYAGPEHPHQAQRPQPYAADSARARAERRPAAAPPEGAPSAGAETGTPSAGAER